MMNARQVPLPLAREGARVAVTAVAGCREARKRLGELGILVGSELELVRAGGGGPLVVAVGRARFALCPNLARKILVAELGG